MDREQREVQIRADRHTLRVVLGGMAVEGAIAIGFVVHEAGQADTSGMGVAAAVGAAVMTGTGMIAEKLHSRRLN